MGARGVAALLLLVMEKAKSNAALPRSPPSAFGTFPRFAEEGKAKRFRGDDPPFATASDGGGVIQTGVPRVRHAVPQALSSFHDLWLPPYRFRGIKQRSDCHGSV
jgi:hypothetical protein